MPEETSPGDADGDAVASGENSGEDAEQEARKPGTFTSETARKAAQARHGARPGNNPGENDPKTKARKALEKKAGQGDVYAARELREHEAYWYPDAASRGDWMQELEPDQRTAVRAIIQWRLAGQHGLPPSLATAQPSAPN